VRRRSREISLLLFVVLTLGIAASALAGTHRCCCEAMIGTAEPAPCDPEPRLAGCCAPPVVLDAPPGTSFAPVPELMLLIAAPPHPRPVLSAPMPRAPERPPTAFAALSTCILRL
jgi:hypothetical protein